MESLAPDINTLKQQRDAYLSAAAKLDAAIRELEGTTEKPIDWKNSALGCIKNHDFPLRTIDILFCMAEKEPDKYQFTDFVTRRNYISALSIALNNLCDIGILDRIAIPGWKGYFYGNKDWFSTKWSDNGSLELIGGRDQKLKFQLYTNPNSVFTLSKTGTEIRNK